MNRPARSASMAVAIGATGSGSFAGCGAARPWVAGDSARRPARVAAVAVVTGRGLARPWNHYSQEAVQ